MRLRFRLCVALLGVGVCRGACARAEDAVNPLDADSAKNPLDETGVRNPLDEGAVDSKAPLRFSLHRFQDISMGGVVSHTVLLPEGWKADGHIEWCYQPIAYPQQKLSFTSPRKGSIALVPTFFGSYTESKPIQGFPPMPPAGTPAPQDIGDWLVSIFRQHATDLSEVQLLDNQQDETAEAIARQVGAVLNAAPNNGTDEYRIVTVSYIKDGERFRQEIPLMYHRDPPYENLNIRSESWSVYISYMLSAPEAIFDSQKTELLRVYSTYHPTAKWWTQVQLTLMELTRLRAEQFAGAVRRRAEQYNQITREQHAKFDKHMSSMDEAQDTRLKLIYERTDYRDADGSTVRLPSHYDHVYTDGKGNYVLTTTTQHKPGETWTEIDPADKP